MSSNVLRVGVLVSGNGSNLQALIDDTQKPDCNYQISVVVSNKPDAFALTRAREARISHAVITHSNFQTRDQFEQALVHELQIHHVDWIVLAGFMRILGPTFLSAFPNRVINLHPALCPAFPGLHAPRQALDYGVRYTGCTVHIVNEGVDSGPILAQAVVPVLNNDTEKTLSKRIQAEEHRLLPKVVRSLSNK